MSRAKAEYEKKLINFIPGDLDTIREAYPNLSYNGIVRNLIHQYASGLRSGKIKPIQFDPSKIELN